MHWLWIVLMGYAGAGACIFAGWAVYALAEAMSPQKSHQDFDGLERERELIRQIEGN